MKLRLPHKFQAALMAALASVSITTLSSATAFAEETAPAASDGDLGLTLFMGDSITHGVLDASYRWQLFKTFVDNGAYFNIDGPISGYYSTPADADNTGGSATYRGVGFVNGHYAKASGRSYEMINGTSRYDNISVATLGQTYDISTGALLIGTNDLLSDGGYTYDNFNTKMQNLLGGTVTHSTSGTDAVWTWQKGSTMGNLGTIADSMNLGAGDEFYVLSVPTWTTHDNNNDATIHAAVAGYNGLLQQWVNEYNATSPATVKYVDVNQGLVDVTSTTPFFGNKAFFNNGADGLHPSEQGSLIMAGNTARAMGIGGRTAGLSRSAATADGWTAAQSAITLHVGDGAQTVEGAQFTVADGYTVDFTAVFGDGSTNNWLDADKDRLAGKSVAKLSSFSTLTESLNITVGDGTHTGTLKLAEGYVAWSAGNGDMVLYCQDNSVSGNEALRIAYREADSANNILGGYYVWKGDMLIGQGLASVNDSLNGISLSITGSQNVGGTISNLSWANTAYAPSTTLFSLEPLPSHDNPEKSSLNIDFTNATAADGRYGTADQPASGDLLLQRTGGTESNGWFGPVGTGHSGNVHMKYSGLQISNNANIISVINGGITNGGVSVVLDDGTHVGKGRYGSTGDQSFHGVYGQSVAGALQLEVNNATLDGGIIMGVINGSGSVGSTNLLVNAGAAIGGDIYGGNSTSGTITGNTAITITGGSVAGSVYGGNQNGGTINGSTSVTITGGVISGNVAGGNQTSGTIKGTTSVTIVGNLAYIGGNITADTVTLQNVTADNEHADTFDKYRGRIRADKVVLHNYTVEQMLASLETKSLVLSGGTVTTIGNLTLTACEITAEDTSAATLDGTLTLGNTATYSGNVTLTDGMTIKMVGGENTSASASAQGGYHGGSWEVMKLAEGETTPSLTVHADTLVGAGMLQGSTFSYNGETGLLSAEGTDYTTYYLEGDTTTLNLTTEQAEHPELQHVVLNATAGTVNVAAGGNNALTDITKQAATALTLDVAGSLTLSGTITGTGGSIEKTGAGTVTLNAASRSGLSDSITVSAGSLVAAVDNSLTSGAVTVNENGTLVLKTYTGVPTISGTGTVQIDFGSGKDYQIHDKAFLDSFGGTVELVSGNLQIGNKTNKFNNAKLKLSGGVLKGWGANFSHDIELAGGTLAEAANNETYSGAISVTANSTVDASSGRTITLSGALTGTGLLTKAGDGTLTLTGDKTGFAGGIYADAGTVNINSATSAAYMNVGNGTLNINADTTVTGDFNVGPANGHTGGKLIVAQNATLTTGYIGSSWGFNTFQVNGVLNTDDLTLSTGPQQYGIVGSGVVNAKAVHLGNIGYYTLSVNRINVGSGGISRTSNGTGNSRKLDGLTLGATADWSSTMDFELANTVTIDTSNAETTENDGAGHNVTLSGVLSGSGSLVKAGAGTLTLSGANTFTGGFAVNAGSLVITRDITTTGLTGTGGTLDVQGALTVNTVEEPGASFGGAVAADSFTVSGSGYQTISGISRLGSSIQVNGGTLHLAAGTYDISGIAPLSAGASSAPAASGYAGLSADVRFIQTSGSGDFDEDGGLDIVYKGNHATTVSEDGIVHFEGTDYTTYYLVTAGDTLNLTQEQTSNPELQNVVVNASGSVSLSDTRSLRAVYQDTDTVLTLTGGGELTVGSFGFGYGDYTYANISIDDGTTLKTGDLNVGEGQAFTTGGEGTYIGGILTVIDDGTTVNLGSNVQLAKLGVTAGNVNISGETTVSGTTDLSNASSSTGVVTVKGTGTLNINGSLWGRNVSHLYMERGGTVNIGSNLSLVGAAADAELVAGGDNVQYSLGSNSWTIKNADATITSDENITIANLFSGNGSLVKKGAGTITLSAANTFTGDLLISGGTVKVGNNSALGASGASHRIEVAANGTLDVNGYQGTGTEYTIVMNGGTLTNTGGDLRANLRQVANHLVLEANSKVKAEKDFGLIANGYNPSSLEMGGHTLTIDGPGTFFVVNATITGGGAIDVHSGTLNFNNGGNASQRGSFASNFVLSGGTLTGGNVLPLANDIYINTTANSTMSLPVQRQGHAITFKGDANLTVSSDLTGPGSIAKEGTGALTLSGTTDVSGTIQLTGGTLNLTPGQGKSVNFNFSNPDAFEKFGEESMGYSYQGTSGYLTGTAQYYLVKGAANTIANHSGAITGATYVSPEGTGAGDVIVSVTRQGSGTYYVNQNMTYGDDEGMASATDFAIKKGFTLFAADSGAYSLAKQLHGEGTYALANNAKALNSGLSLGTDWTGAVRISGYSFQNDMNALNSLANSGSWVELVGVHGWANSSTINANLILGADSNGWSYYQDNGNNNQVLTFNGVVKGTGKFGRYNQVGQNQTYVFTNDISGWTGTYEARSANDRSTTLRLQNNAHVVNATITKVEGVFNVDVQTDVAFSKAITATTLAVTAGHTATLGANVTLGGLTGAGNIASTANITLDGTGNYVFDGAITDAKVLTKSGNGTQTFNGKVTLSGGRNSITAGTVYFNNGFAYSGGDGYALVTSINTTVHFGGNSDLSGKNIGPVAGAKIVLDAGATLKLAQLLNSPSKSEANGTLDMKSGSVLTVTGAMRLTGASSEGGTIHLGNNVTVDLHAGSYQPIMEFGLGAVVLDGANATIQTLSHGGTVKLDSIAGTGTLTLKANSGSTARNTFSIGGSATESEFSGTLALERVGTGSNRVLLAEFNDKYSAADAVVQATLSGTHSSEAVGILINSDVVQMKGLKDGSNITNANSYALASGSASRLADTANAGAATYLNNASDGTFRTLEFTGSAASDSYSTAIKVLSGLNLKMSGEGTQTFTGDTSNFNGSIDVEAGVLNIMKAASVAVQDVTIGANGTLGVYNGTNATPGTANEGTLTIQDTQTLKATGAGATLNANVVMAEGSNLDVSGTGGMGLLMGSSVTINPGNNLTVDGSTDVDSYLLNYFGGDTHKLYTLFEGTAGDPLELYIGSQKVENDITFTDWTKYDMDASTIYTNLQAQTYYLVYDGSNVGMVAIGLIPEPTTSTLSLLALCALAARRRRK